MNQTFLSGPRTIAVYDPPDGFSVNRTHFAPLPRCATCGSMLLGPAYVLPGGPTFAKEQPSERRRERKWLIAVKTFRVLQFDNRARIGLKALRGSYIPPGIMLQSIILLSSGPPTILTNSERASGLAFSFDDIPLELELDLSFICPIVAAN